jgi:hypothetical protein
MANIASTANVANAASAGKVQSLDRVSAAFALSASVAFIFNTVLAWVKDSVPALNTFMAHLTGHHWTTHSLFDLAVFIGLGFVFMSTGTADRMSGPALIKTVIGSAVVGGFGLLAWFLIAG